MLVVHPASLCDVCLDPYSNSLEPHAIACGHIFCLTCLKSLSPSACPLCRKAFDQSRVKKLHVAAPPELDNSDNDGTGSQAYVLLQRVALASGENVSEDEVVEVVTEVDEWLAAQADESTSNLPLRAAMAALRRFQALQERAEREKIEHLQLKNQLRSSKRTADQDLKTSRAVEESLLGRIQVIENEHAAYLSKLRAELDAHRAAHRYRKGGSNPLPPPPQPLPFDQFPGFHGSAIHPGQNGSGQTNNAPPSRTRGQHSNNTSSGPPALKARGTSHTSYFPPTQEPTRARWPDNQNGAQRNPTNPAGQQPVPHAPPERRTKSDDTSRERTHAVAPAPAPPQRTIPPTARSDSDAVSYTNGSSRWTPWSDTTSNSTNGTHGRRARDDGSGNVEPRMSSAAAYVNGYGAGLESGYALAYESAPTPGSSYDDHIHEIEQLGHTIGSLGLVGVPEPIATGTVTSEQAGSRDARLSRRNTTGNAQTSASRTARTRERIPLVEGQAEARPRQAPTLSQILERDARENGAATGESRGALARIAALASDLDQSSPLSTTSWGTVHTVSRGSMSELGLIGLQDGGVTGVIGLESIAGSPEPMSGDDDDEEEDDAGTPVVAARRESAPDNSLLGLIREDDASDETANGVSSRGRSASNSERSTRHGDLGRSASQGQQQQQPQQPQPAAPSSTNGENRARHHHRHASAHRSSASSSSSSSRSGGQIADAGNALGISLGGSSSSSSHLPSTSINTSSSSVRSQHLVTSMNYRPEIIAPTPIVGGPNIAQMWANRA
ncbi:hypothetical protein CONPUDRAFT_140011 [Coniophora puteana RWD-64-598 SS2]|uniref:RING-type domain-containing protein n=1 Tax=Coniophora puteana (strain RWD-64-598) TaxID=741705 RepID=A0A5M3MA76_CONPW|nr:uncharacterized protein CONPUDRAFT_140011 [Coniophora puteana RWD-64-598 SS2]EIW75551.1 hypothetical protein CONPUDRAFT_140011 [Coniophora puteana RWD-64-598 SS2]